MTGSSLSASQLVVRRFQTPKEPSLRQSERWEQILSSRYTAKSTLHSRYRRLFCKRSREIQKHSWAKQSTRQSLLCRLTLTIISARPPRTLEKLQVFK